MLRLLSWCPPEQGTGSRFSGLSAFIRMEDVSSNAKNTNMKRVRRTRIASAHVQTIYRIYTEKKNTRAIVKLLSDHFESFTIHPTLGYYRGGKEQSIAIEIVGAHSSQIRGVAEQIRKMNGQRSILTISFRASAESIRW
jgi:hypothetical protein